MLPWALTPLRKACMSKQGLCNKDKPTSNYNRQGYCKSTCMTNQKILEYFQCGCSSEAEFYSTTAKATSVFPQARVIPAEAQGFTSSPRIAVLRALARSAVLLRDHTSSNLDSHSCDDNTVLCTNSGLTSETKYTLHHLKLSACSWHFQNLAKWNSQFLIFLPDCCIYSQSAFLFRL